MVNSPKIISIFFGTSTFGLPAAEWLLQNTDLQAVVTTPDKPAGRKKQLSPSPVKLWAQKNNLPVLQPEKLKDPEFQEKLRALGADVAVLASYGKIVPREVIDIPGHGTLNLHPSLLPKYRGATPVQSAILSGEKITGITLMQMDEFLDHGPIVAQKEVGIGPEDDNLTLHDKLAVEARDILAENLDGYLTGRIVPREQNHAAATQTVLLKKEDGLINWRKPAEEIERMVRAFQPWPGAYAKVLSKPAGRSVDNQQKELAKKQNEQKDAKGSGFLKIFKAQAAAQAPALPPGEIFIQNQTLLIGTGSVPLQILELQLPGGKKLPAADFIRGQRSDLKIAG